MIGHESITARDLKRIVNREEATPAAIGLFVLRDYWEREHGRRSIVDNKMLRHIESKWAFSVHANELDYWLELGGQLRILELTAIGEWYGVEKGLNKADIFISSEHIAYYAGVARLLYKQATEAGLEVERDLKALAERAETAADSPPSAQAIAQVARLLRSSLEGFLAYHSIMTDAGALLGIPLTGATDSKKDEIEPRIEELKLRLDALSAEEPGMAKPLRRLIRVDMGAVSPSVEGYWEGLLAAYLSYEWRKWARAGVRLPEVAQRAKRLGDLLEQAEQAAAGVEHE